MHKYFTELPSEINNPQQPSHEWLLLSLFVLRYEPILSCVLH